MERRVAWIAPVNTSNAAGYELRWKTNVLRLPGVTNESTVIPLAPGLQTLVVRTTPITGASMSEPAQTTVMMLRVALECSERGAVGPWLEETNFTWASTATNGVKLFRSQIDWSREGEIIIPSFAAAAAVPAAVTTHTEARARANRRRNR